MKYTKKEGNYIMKFYYENNMGDKGIFNTNNLVEAIYTVWNIEANLYIVKSIEIQLNKDNIRDNIKLVFAPWEDNELNSELLKEYGYYMIDGEEEREIREIKTNKIVKYDWDEVLQLI